jgi:CRISPR system Cascade subunit CasC
MKKTFIDFHVIQTVPPSCINRDDTGSPKTAIYGGVTRARVSSQSWKRAIRKAFGEQLKDANLGIRTTRLIDLIASKIIEKDGSRTLDEAKELATKIIKAAGIAIDEKDEAKALFFISTKQAENLADLVLNNNDPAKKDIQVALNKDHGIDVALFGRMVADDPTLNTDASAQVAHSISTHKVENEFDYFTAIDDRKPEDNAGAEMIGTVEFNSSTLYRYATVAAHELFAQLAHSPEALVAAITEFADAFITSMPTGKQNTFANRTLPNAVMVAVRTDQPVNLVGAFEKPVTGIGIAETSIRQLVDHAKKTYEDYSSSPEAVWVIGESLQELGQKVDKDSLLAALDSELTNRFTNFE